MVNKLIHLYPGTILSGESWTSEEIVINDHTFNGDFTLDMTFTGTGSTISAAILCSNGNTFKTAVNSVDFMFHRPAGAYIVPFTLPVCRAFKIVLSSVSGDCEVTECVIATA